MGFESIPQCDALGLQLAAIAGREPESSYIEVRLRRPQGGMDQAFHACQRPGAILEMIQGIGRQTDLYISVCPRARRSGKAEAVERCWTLFADCDTAESVERLRAFRPRPSIVIRSGSGGVHVYWPLRQAIPAGWVKPACRRLARHLGADMVAAEPARVLRPAGTLNYKHTPPTAVECVRLELDVFDLRDVVGGLPDPEPPPAPRRRSTPPADESAAVAGLVRTVRDAQSGGRNNALFWAACRAADDGLDIGQDLRAAAHGAGLGEQEIAAALVSAYGRAA